MLIPVVLLKFQFHKVRLKAAQGVASAFSAGVSIP